LISLIGVNVLFINYLLQLFQRIFFNEQIATWLSGALPKGLVPSDASYLFT